MAERATNARIQFLVRTDEDPLRDDGPNVVRDLSRSPKKISSVYVYDRRGTDLFEKQCETPEYYLRRAEEELLRRHAAEIIEQCGPLPVVELGAGTADKTRVLLAEYDHRGVRCDYFPIDVDTETLATAAERLVDLFPRLHVHCIGTTYEKGLGALPAATGPRLFLFLGSSLGNMELPEMDRLLAELFRHGSRGDYLLLGADLDKDAALIDSAYNDAAGYGPESTLNILRHLNRRYGGDFAVDNFRYRSRYDALRRKNEVRLESLADQTVTLSTLDFSVSLLEGETIDAEVMWKFDPDELCVRVHRAGFSTVWRRIEPIHTYGLFLFIHP